MKKIALPKYLALLFAITLCALSLALPTKINVKASINTYNAISPGTVTQPHKGGTYIDPVFGTKILRVTDSSDGGSGEVAYSYWPVFNCNSTRMIVGIDYIPNLYSFDPTNLSF